MSAAGFTVGQPFNPYKLFTGIFIPEAICKYSGISAGAKIVYGRLCRFAGEDGKAYPAVPTLGLELGISGKQARRYVRELEDECFIRAEREPGRTSHYVFLWHAAFEAPLPYMGVPEMGTPPICGSTTPPIDGSTPLPYMGDEESHKESQLKESHSSSGSLEIQVCDDEPTFSENEKPKIRDWEALSDSARDTLWASVASIKAKFEDIPQTAALKATRKPDAAIVVKILNAFQTFDDFLAWITDTENRALANKARDRHAVYALYLTDAKTRAEGIAEDRLKEEARFAEEMAEQERLKQERETRERTLNTPVAPDTAIVMADAEIDRLNGLENPMSLNGRRYRAVPGVLKRRLVRLGKPITPAEVIQMTREYRGCKECGDRALIGWTLDKTRRFCECIEGDELRHEDPGRPAREIELAHASTKNKLMAAAQMVSVYLVDAIESSTVTETASEVIFDAPKGYRMFFKDKQFSEVMKIACEQRSVRLVAA
jgi:hypothetical protein